MTDKERENGVRLFLKLVEARDSDALLALWSPDGIVEFPFAVPGSPTVYRGGDELRGFWGPALAGMAQVRFRNIDVAALAGTNRAVAFFDGKAMLQDGTPYNNRYACLFEFGVGGGIDRYVEYCNPLVVIDALGSSSEAGQEAAA